MTSVFFVRKTCTPYCILAPLSGCKSLIETIAVAALLGRHQAHIDPQSGGRVHVSRCLCDRSNWDTIAQHHRCCRVSAVMKSPGRQSSRFEDWFPATRGEVASPCPCHAGPVGRTWICKTCPTSYGRASAGCSTDGIGPTNVSKTLGRWRVNSNSGGQRTDRRRCKSISEDSQTSRHIADFAPICPLKIRDRHAGRL